MAQWPMPAFAGDIRCRWSRGGPTNGKTASDEPEPASPPRRAVLALRARRRVRGRHHWPAGRGGRDAGGIEELHRTALRPELFQQRGRRVHRRRRSARWPAGGAGRRGAARLPRVFLRLRRRRAPLRPPPRPLPWTCGVAAALASSGAWPGGSTPAFRPGRGARPPAAIAAHEAGRRSPRGSALARPIDWWHQACRAGRALEARESGFASVLPGWSFRLGLPVGLPRLDFTRRAAI